MTVAISNPKIGGGSASTGGNTAPSTPPPTVGGGPADLPFIIGGGGGGGSNSIPIYGGDNGMGLIVPPGGFAGFAQQTPATQAMFQRAGRIGGKRSAAKRRRKSSKKKVGRAVRAKKRTKRSTKPARLVKGSAAAKKYMASIRRKRRK